MNPVDGSMKREAILMGVADEIEMLSPNGDPEFKNNDGRGYR